MICDLKATVLRYCTIQDGVMKDWTIASESAKAKNVCSQKGAPEPVYWAQLHKLMPDSVIRQGISFICIQNIPVYSFHERQEAHQWSSWLLGFHNQWLKPHEPARFVNIRTSSCTLYQIVQMESFVAHPASMCFCNMQNCKESLIRAVCLLACDCYSFTSAIAFVAFAS